MTKEIDYDKILSSLSEAETQVLIKAGRRTSTLSGYDWNSIIHFSYRFVKAEIPDLLRQGKIFELISLGFKEKGVTFVRSEPKELVSFILWIKDELEAIGKMEQENLSRPPKAEMIAAGIDRFDKYGSLNVVYSISEKFGWSLEYVWNMKYEEVFNLQLYGKETAEFNEALNEIYRKKNKGK